MLTENTYLAASHYMLDYRIIAGRAGHAPFFCAEISGECLHIVYRLNSGCIYMLLANTARQIPCTMGSLERAVTCEVGTWTLCLVYEYISPIGCVSST